MRPHLDHPGRAPGAAATLAPVMRDPLEERALAPRALIRQLTGTLWKPSS